MADDVATTTTDLAMAPSTVQRWQELAAAIPDAEGSDGDGAERIAEALFDASSPEELDQPWDSRDLSALLNVPVRITAVRKAPSDYAHGPGFYLILDLVELETGEKLTATTGAVSVMAQVVKAAAAGWVPLSVVLREAQRPTKAGYKPQHLEVLKAG
ncbi:MAG TPA: hypothetical protein VNF75_03555 [Candidatus Dormibacteraeota bacterium]|nr:hypothetical protein [Candidatus Dormibacteraeota bacterium]